MNASEKKELASFLSPLGGMVMAAGACVAWFVGIYAVGAWVEWVTDTSGVLTWLGIGIYMLMSGLVMRWLARRWQG